MPTGWRTIRVFISSTFRDMQAERDHLVRFVFPRLRAELLKRRVHLVDVDLRWGVTSEQDALSVCREIIDECRPRFLCMLGGRYGWTPPGEERSITADEVYYAALDETEPGGYEFFYFREPAATKSIPEDAAREGGYREFPSDEEVAQFGAECAQHLAEERTRKLEALKQAVRDAGLPVFEYPCRWDEERQRLVDLQAFGDAVYRDLMASIDHELGTDPPPALDWFSEENAAMEAFIEERTERYVVGSRQGLLDEMTAHAGGADGPGVMVVTGQPGSGKSALLGRFYRDYAAAHPDEIVIPHFVGASRGSTSIRQTLRRLCHDIAQAAGIDDEIPEDVRELASLLPQLLERTAGRELTDDDGGGLEARPTRHVGRGEPAEDGGGLEARPTPEVSSATRPVVIIIDALNQLDATDNAHALTWLPVALPEGVRIICSSLEHHALDALRRRGEHVREVVCGPLTPDDAGAIVDEVLARYRKRFDDAQRSVLLAKPDAGVPLYLLAALEELRTLGTYERISQRIKELPGTVTELFDWILQRLEQGVEGQEAFGKPLVSTYTASIAVGRGGMTESELEALCESVDDEDEFWVLHRVLRPYLMARGELVDYFHGQLREAVERRYLYDDEARRHRHGLIAEHLQGRGYEYVRMLSELPYHLTAAEAWDTLEDTLTDLTFLETKTEAGMVFDLAGDFTVAVDAIPRERPVWKHLRLLNQALRNDLHFISRHPSTLFQCFWNSAWWYDCDDAAKHYDPPDGGWGPDGAPWERPEPRLCTLLERWREQKERREPGFVWLRSSLPPHWPLGGAQIARLSGHERDVRSVTFSPDGRRLASGSDDRTVRVWATDSGEEIACLRGHWQPVWAVAFSPDGRRLASAAGGGRIGEDNTVRVWDTETGAELMCLIGHKGAVHSVAFSPDGQRIVSGDGMILVRDVTSGAEIASLPEPTSALAFLPDGRRIASYHNQKLRVWDLESDPELVCLKGVSIRGDSSTFSADGRWFAAALWDNTVRIWELGRGVEVACLRGHDGPVFDVTFSPGGQRVASTSRDRTVRIWDTESGAQMLRLDLEAPAISVAFAPDGGRIAAGMPDGTVRILDSENELDVSPMRGQATDCTKLAFSPDGQRIAAGMSDGTVRILDSASGIEKACLRGPAVYGRSVLFLSFSPDGRRIVSVSGDNTVLVWDAVSGARVARFLTQDAWLSRFDFSPDGRLISSGSWEYTTHVWNLEARAWWHPRDRAKEIASLQGSCKVAFAPDARWFASGARDGTVQIWDGTRGAEIACLLGHTGRVFGVAWSPDGRRIASASNDRTVRVWDVDAKIELACLRGHSDVVWSVAFAPDGRWLASASSDHSVRIWDVDNHTEIACLHGGNCWVFGSVVFSPDGRWLAVGSSGPVQVWDARSGADAGCLHGLPGTAEDVVFSLETNQLHSTSSIPPPLVDSENGAEIGCLRGHEGIVLSVAFSPDGQRLVTGGSDGTTRIWDVEGHQELSCLNVLGGMTTGVIFSPDGRWLAAGLHDHRVRVWDAEVGAEVACLRVHGGWLRSVAFSPDGQRIATGADRSPIDEDITVGIWDVQTGTELVSPNAQTSAVNSVVFSPDGRWLASGSDDRTVRVWDVESGEERTCMFHRERVACVAFSPNGQLIASVSGGAARLWDGQNAAEVASMRADGGPMTSLAFSPDGRRIVSGGVDNAVRVWDVESGVEVACLWGHDRPVSSVAFSPDGQRIASASWDGSARLWDVDAGDRQPGVEHAVDSTAVETGTLSYPWRALHHKPETAIEDVHRRVEIAWFPDALRHIATHQSVRKWAGLGTAGLTLMTLEGRPSGARGDQ